MKPKFIILLLFPAVFFFVKCQKAPDFPVVPSIAFLSFNQNKIHPDKDSLKVTFSFTDGDGDLGYQQGQNTSSDTTIYITDIRLDKSDYTYVFDMPYITPKGSYKQVSGNFTIDMISDCHCRPDHAVYDTVWYKIKIRDRAGHVSNVIQTPKVYLICN